MRAIGLGFVSLVNFCMFFFHWLIFVGSFSFACRWVRREVRPYTAWGHWDVFFWFDAANSEVG